MKLINKTNWNAKGYPNTIEMAARIAATDHTGGTVEDQTRAGHEQLANMFGALLERLHGAGRLTDEDVVLILNMGVGEWEWV